MERRYLAVIGGCITQFVVIGLLFSFGLLFKVFETEFGWSRTLLSAANSLSVVMMGLLAMVAGPMADRFGPRPVLMIAGVSFGTGFILLSQITAPWQLFAIAGTLIALGLGAHDVVTLGTVARWFSNRRGLMTAVVKVGTALGQVTMPPLTALAIGMLGWRAALAVLGASAIVLLVGAASLVSRPEATGGTGAVSDVEGESYAEARRDRRFWTLCIVQLLFFASLMAVPLHLAPHGMDMGMSPAVAATLLSVIGAASIVGRLSVGRLLDRIGGRGAYLVCLGTLAVALGGLIVVDTRVPLYCVVALYGFAHGGLFVVVSPTVAEYFGMRAHGAIFGTVVFFGTLGGAVGPILAGAVFDATGGYAWAFGGLMIMAICALGLVLSIPRPQPLEATA